MKKKDLDALSLDELKVLRKDVEKAIADYKDRQLEKARQEVEALARETRLFADRDHGWGHHAETQARSAQIRAPRKSCADLVGAGPATGLGERGA
jgi:hypothetical protein